jgi:RimJ/RimL family protein N-acetyltransferase
MFPFELETERLRLVRLCRDTASTGDLYRYVNVDAPHIDEICEYVHWEPHRTMKETHDYLTAVETRWDERSQATYAIYPAAGEEGARALAGTTNLRIGWERRAAELGIWLRKPFWGRGYSGERAAALLELAFERLDLELVGAAHQDGNEASKRAIEKYVDAHGGQYDGLLRNWIPSGGEVRDLRRYTISQQQYRGARREGESRRCHDGPSPPWAGEIGFDSAVLPWDRSHSSPTAVGTTTDGPTPTTGAHAGPMDRTTLPAMAPGRTSRRFASSTSTGDAVRSADL